MDEERKGLGCDYDKRIISVVIWFTVELSKDDFTLATRIIWLSSFFGSRNPLSRNSWYEPQVMEYRIIWEIWKWVLVSTLCGEK
jgi:hypothetical protein